MKRAPLKVEFVNPFVEATCHVVRTMLNMEVTRGALYVKQGSQPSQEVSGIIHLTGAAQGTLILGMSPGVALQATEILVGERPAKIDAVVVDAVGELTNIIAGNAKAQLEQLHLRIGLPSVISGRQFAIPFPAGAIPIGIPFNCTYGPISMEVSLVESPLGAMTESSSRAPERALAR